MDFFSPGSTASRPVPSADIDGRLRFNTDTLVYEYYDTISSTWVELSGSGTGTVNPGATNAIAYYASAGTIVSGLNTIDNALLVTDASGVPSFQTTLPSGLSIPGAIITSSTAALTSGQVAATPVNATDIANKAYVDASFAAGVNSITGTTNQIIASSATGNVTLSLPQDIAHGSTPTFGGLTLTNPHIAGAGGLVSFQIFTSGTASTYTKPAGVTSILVEMVGGGGGGGGSLGGASTLSAGAGGGAGGYARLYIASASSTYTYTVGSGGAGGLAGNNAGTGGGTSTFSASSLQATGGGGGGGGATSVTTSVSMSAPGGGGVGSNGDINSQGSPGYFGVSVLIDLASGSGGNSIYGGAGISIVGGAGIGTNAGNYGSGGSGACSTTSSNAGGNGSSGLIIVWELS